MKRLVPLGDAYILDLEILREAVLDLGDGKREANLVLYLEPYSEGCLSTTEFDGDEALAVWHSLKDVLWGTQDPRRVQMRPDVP